MAHGELTRVRAVDSIVVVETSIDRALAIAGLMAWVGRVVGLDVPEATSHDQEGR